MATCNYCSLPLRTSYYLIDSAPFCSDCVSSYNTSILTYQRRFTDRGVVFAGLAALVACVLQWCIFDLSQMGDWRMVSVYLRGGGNRPGRIPDHPGGDDGRKR